VPITLSYPSGGALVAGGTGRVGGGVTRRLAAAGVPTYFSYRNGEDRGRAIEAELRAEGATATLLYMDMDDAASVEAALDRIEAETGRCHTVIYTAGPPVPPKTIAELSPEDALAWLQSDALGCYRLFHLAIPALRRGGGGSLVATSTVGTRKVIAYDGVSPFSKGAVDALVRQIAGEEAKHGIRANAVGIGVIVPPGYADVIESFPRVADPQTYQERYAVLWDDIRAMIRMGRAGLPEEAGNLFAFLASDQASYVTGQWIAVDGGVTL
jgi:NAD(P)-dependent dehydrogenase (short-subunit alcohol dehydrogenase family)